jgi:hypothetical protein
VFPCAKFLDAAAFRRLKSSPCQVFAVSGLCRIEPLTHRVSMCGFDDAFLTGAPPGPPDAAVWAIS